MDVDPQRSRRVCRGRACRAAAPARAPGPLGVVHRAARALLALLPLAALAGCGPAPAPPPTRIFLITVDTLRADHLGFHGYPRDTSPVADRLAADGVVFEHAIAQWPKTGASFASVFSGRYPQTTGITHRARLRLPAELLTLPELLQQHGYRTVAAVSNVVLEAELGWDQGFDEYVETWEGAPRAKGPRGWKRALSARHVNVAAQALLERHADAEKLFVWLHYSDPHAPTFLFKWSNNPFIGDPWYREDEEVAPELLGAALLGDHRERRYYLAQYDANVLYSDVHIGRILRHAGELGLLEDALVIFTSDHGEALGDREFWGHGKLPYNDTAHVPLLFHRPGAVAQGRRVPHPVELVDLYPTLRDLAAPDVAVAGLEGASLAGYLTPERPPPAEAPAPFRFAFSEAGDMQPPNVHYRSVQDERFKLIYHPPIDRPERAAGSRDAPSGAEARVELYDLVLDPGERRDLADERAAEVERLEAVLQGWLRSPPETGPEETGEPVDEETLEALRVLGYVE